MVPAVYIMQAGPNTDKSTMELDEECEWQEPIDSECSSLEKNKVALVNEIPEMKKEIPTKLILQRMVNLVGQTG